MPAPKKRNKKLTYDKKKIATTLNAIRDNLNARLKAIGSLDTVSVTPDFRMRVVRGVTREQFVGEQMANFLYYIANSKSISVAQSDRDNARELYEKWRSFATFRLDNPIVAAELEALLFPKGA